MSIRNPIVSAVGLALFLTAPIATATAQDYPSEPVRIVVAWPAGGGHDIVARLLGHELSEALGTSVVVDNVTGAGGSTGMRAIDSAEPDGYTIGIMGMHAISQSFMNINATALDRLDPLVYISDEPGALEVISSTGIDTLEAYVAKMKEDPSALVNGNDPQGGNSFVFANSIASVLGVDMRQIPYQGHSPNVTGLITGEVQSATLPIPPILEHARAGTVKVLGVTATERHPLLPDVPTFQEQGFDLIANDFIMVVAPVGIDPAVRARLVEGLEAAIQTPEFIEAASRNGMVLRQGGPDLAAAELTRQVEVVYPLLDASGLVAPTLRRN